MAKTDLIERNKKFALSVLRLLKCLPSDRFYDPLIRQLVRCVTSVGANYRAACRAKSDADFIYKLKIVEEEADECLYFLEILNELDEGKNKDAFRTLLKESNELVAIYVTSIRTAKRNR